MDEEGIMALGPRPMDQMEQPMMSGMMPPEESISYGEAYSATKNALRESQPGLADQYEMGMGEILAEIGTLTAEELDALRDIIEYIEQNKDRYQEVVAELIAQDLIDEGDLPPEYDEEFMAILRAAVEEAYQRGMALQLPAPQGFAGGGLADAAEMLRQQGRFGDTMLAHITPEEAGILKAMGGSGTINPATGLPEFFLGKVFKAIGRVVRGVVRGVKKVLNNPIGRIIGTIALTPFVGPVAAGAIVGGVTGGVKGAIIGGIGGYVGSPQFMNSALGTQLGQGVVGALGRTGAEFAFRTATGTALGLASGAKLSDAVKGGVVNASLSYALSRGRPMGEQPAPIEDRSFPAQPSPTETQQSFALPPQDQILSAPLPPSGPVSTAPATGGGFRIPGFTPGQQQFAPASQIIAGGAAPVSPMGAAAGQTPPPTTPPPKDFSFSRFTQEPLSYAKDVYSEYLSPSRPGITDKSGLIEKYGPLTAAGLGAMYLGGGFEPQQVRGPGLIPGETGRDYLRKYPSLYYIQNLPGVVYNERGAITGSRPYSFESYNPLVNPEDVTGYNTGGIAALSRRYPRMNGQINGPGTEKSDSIPAMLSDGEFVMTARAVRGMGNGSRREGAKRMYKLMSALEKNASRSA
jgi:hypothetical protein